nr:hypothetical protein [Dyadobacter sp. NIV53]
MITMILGGLWHGAAISYAVWGAFHGIALALERFITDKVRIKETPVVTVVKTLFVFFSVTLAWLLFKLPEFDHVIKYLQSIANNTHLKNDYKLITYILVYSSIVVFYHAAYLIYRNKSLPKLQNFDYVAYAMMLFLIMTNSGSSGSFIYFQF